MNIKTATAIAIAGIAISFVMSIVGQFLLSWLVQSASSRESIANVQRGYFMMQSVLHYGCLLVFFVTLYSRQKEQAP